MADTAKVRTSKTHGRPTVYSTVEAYMDMLYITLATKDEVGWFCEVEQVSPLEFLITDVFLPTQETNGGTTEIQSGDLADFAVQHLEERGEEAYNRLRGWGHSHPGGYLSPSSQDQEMVDSLAAGVDGPFVAVRMTQSGSAETDVAWPSGVTWERLNLILGVPNKERQDMWTQLVKERVHRLSSKTVYAGSYGGYRDTGRQLPAQKNGKSKATVEESEIDWSDPWVRDLKDGKWKVLSQCSNVDVNSIPDSWWGEKFGTDAHGEWDMGDENCEHEWIEHRHNGVLFLECIRCDAELVGEHAEALHNMLVAEKEGKVTPEDRQAATEAYFEGLEATE